MNDNSIFVITVFETCGFDGMFADIGCGRSPCFRHTFEEAERIVLNNVCDIREDCFDYAAITEIGPEVYPYPISVHYYKYNKELERYEPIERPDEFEHWAPCPIF